MSDLIHLFTVYNVLKVYGAVCASIALYFLLTFGYEDITGKYDSKFGPNYKSGFAWTILAFSSVPFVNLLTLLMFTWIWIRGLFEVKKDAKSV